MKNPRRKPIAQGSGLWAVGTRPEPRTPNPEQSFSLIELLLASVIIAGAGALLIGGLIAANRGAAIRGERILFAQLLSSQLALLDDPLEAAGPARGHYDGTLSDVQWTMDTADAEPPLAPLQQVTLTVAREGDTASIVTLRRAPDVP